MDELNGFSVRVYGVCLEEDKVLCLQENFEGKSYCKLPGGGLEFGEGVIECLKREFLEELNVQIEIIGHLYTQEDFVESFLKNGKQLLFIYYIVRIINLADLNIGDKNITGVTWRRIDGINPFGLPLDNIAFNKYLEIWKN